MPRKRTAVGTRSGGGRGIARVASDFLSSWTAQANELSEGQRTLMSRMALELLAQAKVDGEGGSGDRKKRPS